MPNPFNFGNPVLPHQMVGRLDLLESITNDLINPGGHSHIVIGGRRFGKSSFLQALQYFLARKINQTKRGDCHVIPVFINLQSLIKNSPEGVFGLMVKVLQKYFDPQHAQKRLGIHFDLGLEKTKLHFFVQSKQRECALDEFCEIINELSDVFSNAYGLLRLIFLIDEIEVGLDKDWTEILFGQLRSLIHEDVLRNHIRYVIAGSSRVIDVREKGSPLLNMLKISHLDALDEKSILEIIDWAGEVPSEVANVLVRQCGGHPFIAQYLMHYLWEDDVSLATTTSVLKLVNRFIHERHADLENWLVSIGKAGRVTYKFLAETNDWLTEAQVRQLASNPELNIGSALVALCYHGLIIHDGTWNNYHFAGELFKNWFETNVLPSLYVSLPNVKPFRDFENNDRTTDTQFDSRDPLKLEKSFRSREMPGISNSLYNRLRETLLECGPFDSDSQLRAVFANDLLAPWRKRLPEANSLTDRVDAVIHFLLDKRYGEPQTSALVILLGVLKDRTDPNDACHARLAGIAEELGIALQVRFVK